MSRLSGRKARRTSPWLFAVAFSLCASAALGCFAVGASAKPDYVHGGIAANACEVCHTDNHTNWPVTSEKCLTCHARYAVPDQPSTCWTCHTPGLDMAWARADTACAQACHLADGEVVQHAAHAGSAPACTQCHPLSPSVSDPGGSPHHTAPVAPVPSVAAFAPASGTGGGFTWSWRPARGGVYRIGASVRATQEHTAARSGWTGFLVR